MKFWFLEFLENSNFRLNFRLNQVRSAKRSAPFPAGAGGPFADCGADRFGRNPDHYRQYGGGNAGGEIRHGASLRGALPFQLQPSTHQPQGDPRGVDPGQSGKTRHDPHPAAANRLVRIGRTICPFLPFRRGAFPAYLPSRNPVRFNSPRTGTGRQHGPLSSQDAAKKET